MFIGREQEMKKLDRMYQSGKLEVAIIYGRRRVGKTTLINEFCRDRKTVFFAALENSAEQNLEALSGAITAAELEDSQAGMTYRSFADAFTRIREMAARERLIWVIDEYPYLARAEPGISSLLQNFIDHQFQGTKLFIILCGSSMSFMEHQVLGYESPLYGRRTAQFKILPFDYLDTGKWFPAYSSAEKAIMYGVTGGVPMYLEQFSPDRSVRENLLEGVFDRNAVLFEEPSNLLKQELREPATYNAIITAIASGKTKLSEISSAVGLETGACSKYMNNLIALGILKREVPVTQPNSKRPVYLIEDLFFRFWFTFIPKNTAAVVSGRIRRSFQAAVESRLYNYMGLVFEKMCRDYVLYYDDGLPLHIGAIGQWWGGDPRTHRQVQLDIVATSADDRCGLIGSCKFRNEPVGTDEYARMQAYAQAMNCFDRHYFYLFSKSGFTSGLLAQQSDTLRLITLDELYGARRND